MTRSHTLTLVLITAVFTPSCRNRGGQDDAGADADVGTQVDGGLDGDIDADDGAMDAANDAAQDTTLDARRDAMPLTHPAIPGCDVQAGIECDGDWRGVNPRTGSEFCSPACDASQCCVPQDGRFVCVEPNDQGLCPVSDIFIDATRITNNVSIETRLFEENSCALFEQCVNGSGQRRLLRFDTWTPNIGLADMFLGQTPAEQTNTEYFEWSECHMHHHFNSYADYELLRPDGTIAARGHKQAFCLLDYYQYPDVSGGFGGGGTYNCNYQGIRRNWQDVYSRDLDCQWVDITDVPPGPYQLRIRVNFEHLMAESDYSNNEILVPVTVTAMDPPANITSSCLESSSDSTRDCGWIPDPTPVRICMPGTEVDVGCSAACGLGACSGDPILRVCDANLGNQCTSDSALGANDDSDCAGGQCAGDRDCCPRVTFVCPPSGAYSVFWAPLDTSLGPSTGCTIAATPTQ